MDNKERQVNTDLLISKPANEWLNEANKQKIPAMLFSELWYEGELCILFADTNVGKSILAVQIGNSISKGEPINGFKLTAQKQPVLYFDFELTKKQFENRYSVEYQNHYIFDKQFYRVEINPDADFDSSFEQMMYQEIKKQVVDTGVKVLIIDNISVFKHDLSESKNASPLIKWLKNLKNEHNLSILVLAHTPKRNLTIPIDGNHLQGSKMLMNLCDSAFAINVSSQSNELRYIKQIKQRNTEQLYGEDNVCVCNIIKPDNFLMFKFVDYDNESNHLKRRPTQEEIKFRNLEALELFRNGMTHEKIGEKFGVSEGAVRKWLKKVS